MIGAMSVGGHRFRCVAAALATCLCTAGCDDPPPTDGARPVRLAELLPDARIEGALVGVAPAASIRDLGDVRRQEILAEGFGSFDLARAGWPDSAAENLAEVEGDRVYAHRGASPDDTRRWIFTVQPSRHYVLERRVRTETPLDVDFAVLEGTDPGSILSKWAGPFALGQGGAIKIHWPEQPEADGAWQQGSVSFFTTPQTRALCVVLRSTPDGRARRMRWGGAAESGGATLFDDIRLARLAPTPRQKIALLKAQDLAEGADPQLGIEKHGQFVPLANPAARDRSGDDTFAYRYALYAPPPTDMGFGVTVPARAVLRFSCCLSRHSQPRQAARFEVLVRADGHEESVFRRTLTAAPGEWCWHDETVDLAAYAGRAVELVLRTEAMQGRPHALWGNPVLDVPPAASAVRNVVLIAIDTLRADRLSCYGHGEETSPHLDALAADGVRFENVVANANWTCPSFASIFTGVVPARHGVWASAPVIPLPASFETLAERFRARGWATHSIAYKAVMYGGGYEQGFDVAFNVPRGETVADDNLAEAMEWLEANAERRNFLFLHFDDPHQPCNQPQPYDQRFGDPAAAGIHLPVNFEHDFVPEGPLRDVARQLYAGEIAYVDDRIGAFLAELKRRGLYEDAVIALVSDHGEAFWEHGLFGHGGNKLHDEVARVPLIVKPPGAGPAGVVVQAQVRAFDVMPTLLELAGVPVPEGLDAESLVGMWGQADAADRVAVTESSKNALALRTRRWKLILRYGRAEGEVSRSFLHDLHDDPAEQRDVAARFPEVTAELRLRLLDYVLRSKPGLYAVGVRTEHGPAEVELAEARGVVPLFGARPQPRPGGGWVFGGGTRGGPLWFVAEVEAALDAPRYTPGDLQRLLEQEAGGLHLFAGPPVAERTEMQSIDLQQLEAIRALGYVGEGGTPDAGDK